MGKSLSNCDYYWLSLNYRGLQDLVWLKEYTIFLLQHHQKVLMSLFPHLIVATRINGCNLSGHETIAQLGKGPTAQWHILYFMHVQYNYRRKSCKPMILPIISHVSPWELKVAHLRIFQFLFPEPP